MANPEVLNTGMTDEEILAALAHYLAANNPHNVTAEQVPVSVEGITAETVQAALLELLETITALRSETFGLGVTIPEAADLNDYTTPGRYCSPTAARTATLANSPTSAYGFSLEVKTVVGGRFVQILTPNAAGVYYMRSYLSAGWSSWFKFVGEEMTA